MSKKTKKTRTGLVILSISLILVVAGVGIGVSSALPSVADDVVDTGEYEAEITGFEPMPVHYLEMNESGDLISQIATETLENTTETSSNALAEVIVEEAVNNTIKLNISSEENTTHLIPVTISTEALNVTQPGDIEVLFDNSSVELADDLTDITSIEDDDPDQLYWVTNVTENSSQVLIRNNEWSSHIITIQEAEPVLGGSIGDALDDTISFLDQRIAGIPLWSIIAGIVLVGALIYKRET